MTDTDRYSDVIKVEVESGNVILSIDYSDMVTRLEKL